MKKLSLMCVSVCALLTTAQAADYKWISDGTGTGTVSWLAKNFQVWNGSGWSTATVAPGVGDNVVGNTAIQMGAPAAVNSIVLDVNNTFSAPVVGGQQLALGLTATLNINTISLNFTNVTDTFMVRGGTLSLGSLTVKNGYFQSYASSANYITNMTISDGVYVYNGTAAFSIKTAASANNNYRIGSINFVAGTEGASWSTRAVVLGANASSSFTVSTSGISGEGRITSGTGAAGTKITLAIDTAAGTTYSGRPFIYGNANVAVGVVKTGAGTQILTSNSSTYSGGTTVSAGTLLVGGAANQRVNTARVAGSGAVLVENGATLGFDAYLNIDANDLTVMSGATLLTSAGAVSNATVACGLTSQSDIVMQDGSTLGIVVDAASTYSNALALVNGATLSANNITLNIVAVNGALESGKTYTLITGLSDGYDVSGWTLDGVDAELGYSLELNSGTLSLVSSIPEPAVGAALLGAAAVVVVIRRRGK